MAGKVWLVTGSSRGLGRAVVQAAQQAGDRVMATARRYSQLAGLTGLAGRAGLAGLAAEHGQGVLVLPLDVSADDAAASAAKAAVARFGRIGQKVVVRFTNSGTQTGPFLGALPTGRHAEWPGIGIYTVTNGKISEAWFGEDVLGVLLQLGIAILPRLSAAGPAAPGGIRHPRQSPQQAERKSDHA